MKKVKESYAVVIIPHPTSRSYRFSLTKKTVRFLTGILLLGVIFTSGFVIHYVSLIQDAAEFRTLRKETALQHRQLQTFAAEMLDLKKQLGRLNEMDAKLRVIAGINPPTRVATVLGMGGAEITGLSEIEIGIHPKMLTRKVEDEIKLLKKEASYQEVSFEDLAQDMRERQSVWNSTPSVWPVKGWLSSGFGKRISPFTGRLTMHNGVDIATRQNSPIIAPAEGIVNHEGYHRLLGRFIKISHGNGMQTLYGHLAKSNVRIGQKVKRGDVIGYVGNTGISTGPHVHYEVMVNGLPVNPLRYVIN